MKILYSSAIMFALIAVLPLGTVTAQRGLNIEYDSEAGEEEVDASGTAEKDAQITVTGTRLRKHYRKSPVRTDIVSSERMEAKNAANLFEALNGENGLGSDNQCQNCGLNDVRINGLSGSYTQTLINSVQAVPSLVNVYFMQQLPVDLIERVEIVRGGGSALYGSGAIGGSINVITRKPLTNSANFSYRHEFLGFGARAYNVSGFGSAVNKKGNMGIAVYGSKRKQDEWDRNHDRFSDLARIDNLSFGVDAFYTITEGMSLSARYFNVREHRRGGDNIDAPEILAFIAERINSNIHLAMTRFEHSINKYVNYEVNFSYSNMERSTYYGGRSDLLDVNELVDQAQVAGLSRNPYYFGNAVVNVIPLEGHTITVGGEYWYEDLWDGNATTKIASVNTHYQNGAGFLQYNWEHKIFDVLAGVRIDKHSILDKAIVNPRANAIFKKWDFFKVRLGAGTGFKAPQVFSEDFHIEQASAGGVTSSKRIFNLPNLKQERSVSYTGDISGDVQIGKHIDFDYTVGGFYTTIKGKLEVNAEDALIDLGTVQYFPRYNVPGTSKIAGGNAEISLLISEYARLTSGFTYTPLARLSQRNLESGNRKMLEVPEVSGMTMVELFYWRFTASFSNQIIGKMKVLHGGDDWVWNGGFQYYRYTPTFYVFNVRLKYRQPLPGNTYIEIFGGVDNITNTYQRDLDRMVVLPNATVLGERDAGYVYGPTKPLTFYAGVKGGF